MHFCCGVDTRYGRMTRQAMINAAMTAEAIGRLSANPLSGLSRDRQLLLQAAG
jgi:hypothetical protein